LGRVNRYPQPWREWVEVTIQFVRPRPDSLDYPGKFVSQNQWALQSHIADAGIFVIVQVTATNTHGGDPHQRLARPRRPWPGNLFDPQISRTVQSNRSHG
jgi:hypothetical protein